MMLAILFYSGFTCLSAFSQTWWHMVSLRFFVAIGVGGEWAVASAMVAEVFPAHARSMSLGIFHASSILGVWAAVAAGVWIVGNPFFGPPDYRWRWAFGVGLLPALLTLWIYASLHEPERWVQARAVAAADRSRPTGRLLDLFTPDLLRSTLVGWPWRRSDWPPSGASTCGARASSASWPKNARLGDLASQLGPEARSKPCMRFPTRSRRPSSRPRCGLALNQRRGAPSG